MEAVLEQERVNSTHKVEVVPVRLEPHPNADKLSVVRVFGYVVCTGSADWLARTPHATDDTGTPVWLGAYVPPDSLVDVTLPEFAFLADRAKSDGRARIKAMRLRGVESFGLLVPAPPGSELGDDVTTRLKVEHYNPPEPGDPGVKGVKFFTGGEVAAAPDVRAVKYDLEAFRRYHHLFVPGERVVVTEKVDGSNARYVFRDGRMHCGSIDKWKKEFPDYSHLTVEGLVAKGVPEDKATEVLAKLHAKPKSKNLWWAALEKTPALEAFCRANEGVVVYGEVFGNVNCIKYGFPDGNRFAAFDLMKDGRWLDSGDAWALSQRYGLPWVPILGQAIPYAFETVCLLAEGTTTTAGAKSGTIREGCVVRPMVERRDYHAGRVCFKVVSVTFSEKYR